MTLTASSKFDPSDRALMSGGPTVELRLPACRCGRRHQKAGASTDWDLVVDGNGDVISAWSQTASS